MYPQYDSGWIVSSAIFRLIEADKNFLLAFSICNDWIFLFTLIFGKKMSALDLFDKDNINWDPQHLQSILIHTCDSLSKGFLKVFWN